MMIYSITAIALGAMIGALSRWGLSQWLNHSTALLPIGTWVANLLGAYGIGLAAAYFEHSTLSPHWRLFVITGMMGSLTTFSTFSLETLTMIQEGKWGTALLNSSLHLGGSFFMTFLGLMSAYYLSKSA